MTWTALRLGQRRQYDNRDAGGVLRSERKGDSLCLAWEPDQTFILGTQGLPRDAFLIQGPEFSPGCQASAEPDHQPC